MDIPSRRILLALVGKDLFGAVAASHFQFTEDEIAQAREDRTWMMNRFILLRDDHDVMESAVTAHLDWIEHLVNPNHPVSIYEGPLS